MVVPVLITSCHVSLYPNIGPVAAQIRTVNTARAKVTGLPDVFAIHLAKLGNHENDRFFAIHKPAVTARLKSASRAASFYPSER
jgi:hypothetical protein